MSKYSVSVIVVVYNAEKTIERCLASILGQSETCELIIIDGCSTDSTLQLIRGIATPDVIVVSEPDKGIYDAMNKGVALATGDYVYFLGADDYFYNDQVISKILRDTNSNNFDLIMGKIIYNSGKIVKPRFSPLLYLHNSVHHQGALYNRKLFHNFQYDINCKILSDYELNLKCYINRRTLKILTVDLFVAICADDGLSHTRKDLFIIETNKIRYLHLQGGKYYFAMLVFRIKLYLYKVLKGK